MTILLCLALHLYHGPVGPSAPLTVLSALPRGPKRRTGLPESRRRVRAFDHTRPHYPPLVEGHLKIVRDSVRTIAYSTHDNAEPMQHAACNRLRALVPGL